VETPLDPLAPWDGARLLLAGERLGWSARQADGGVTVTLTRARGAPGPVDVEKLVSVRDATLAAGYRLRPDGSRGVAGRWAVQWNLALTAGDAEGRYLALPGRPSLGGAGRVGGFGVSGARLVDRTIAYVLLLPEFGDERIVSELDWRPSHLLAFVRESGDWLVDLGKTAELSADAELPDPLGAIGR